MSDDTDEQLTGSDSSDSSLYNSIKRMSSSAIHTELEKHNLCTNGESDVLKKRLYTHLRVLDKVTKLKAFAENNPNPLFHYYCVLDFECTCAIEKRGKTYSNEIIEFPSLLINASSAKIASSFHSYCRPVINPVLSEFCTRFTGIKQENVDSAPLFPEVFKHFLQWIKIETDGKSVAFVTDGNQDIATFLQKQLLYFNLDIPKELRSWIDIKESFSVIFSITLMKLNEMLNVIGLQFEGTKHSGMDDAKNISRIVIWLSEFKIFLDKNAKLSKNRKFLRALSDDYSNYKIEPDGSSFSLKTAKLPYLLAVKRSKYYARLRKFNSTSDNEGN
ncbi:3'-5' exoribonuclease 1 [Trichinella papuae]|uniref:3'-5' exoribonuclease 1 n=1 Tax=Trichinella papuae TaxID=268474 RepID=A0A0V1N9I7_9BILA|nr:3'-5' exoribonuclease 1 [Trichinella papuae]